MASNRELIESLYDAFARGDAGHVLGMLSPDVDWNEAENNPYADRNPYDSPKRVGEEVFGRLLSDFPDFSVHPDEFVAEGDTVVALGRYRGTHQASARQLDAQFVHVWKASDGKVTSFQQYTDTAQFRDLVG